MNTESITMSAKCSEDYCNRGLTADSLFGCYLPHCFYLVVGLSTCL